MNEEKLELNLATIESLENENNDLRRDILAIDESLEKLSSSGVKKLIAKKEQIEIEKQTILSRENYSQAYFDKHREQKEIQKEISESTFTDSDENDLKLLKIEKEEKIQANIEEIERLNQESV